MKKIIIITFVIFSLITIGCSSAPKYDNQTSAGAPEVDWQNDYVKSMEKASKEGKHILINFSGSNWCGWCVQLEEEVFSQPAFKAYARDNLVCVKADFPRPNNLPAKQVGHNRALAEQFKVSGYPTILITTPGAEVVFRTGYVPGGAENYVKHLQSNID